MSYLSCTAKRCVALLLLVCLALIGIVHGAQVAIILAVPSSALLAGHGALLRGQLGIAPDTFDIASELNLDVILSSAMRSFKRVVLPLRMFATVFRNVQLKGTDKITVPYFPLQGATSKNFNGVYDFSTGAGGKLDKREVTINKRKYQPLAMTSEEIARYPQLNAEQIGAMKGERLAYDVVQDILSVVTAANFPQVCFVGDATTFDSDDVINIRTSCNKNATGPLSVTDGVTTNGDATITSATAAFHSNDIGVPISGTGIPVGATIASINSATSAELSTNATADGTGVTFTLTRPVIPWPMQGRGLMVTPDYDGNLFKDDSVKAAYAYGGAEVIRQGRLPDILGFMYAQSAAIPSNGENLVGFAAFMSAILVAFSPIPPAPGVRAALKQYDIIDDPDGTDIAFEYRVWGDPDTDTEKRVLECNYGYNVGESLALKRMKSA